MPTVSPQQWNTQDAITSSKLNAPVNQIAAVVNGGLDDANIASLSGSKINSGTLPASAMDAATNVITRTAESMANFVSSGCVWSISSGLVGTMTLGVVYIGGKRVPVSAVASYTFVTNTVYYVSVDNNGVISYTGVATPPLPANSLWLAVITTNATNITSIAQAGIDSTGKFIYSTSPGTSTVASFTNTGAGGGTFYYQVSPGGRKEVWGQTNAFAVGANNATANVVVNWPTGLFTVAPSVQAMLGPNGQQFPIHNGATTNSVALIAQNSQAVVVSNDYFVVYARGQ